MTSMSNRYSIGQLVEHRLFHYRGVVVGVDETFQGTEEWYQTMARTHPPKDRPWYHVLVDGAAHRTYVAQRNLEADKTGLPIRHPELSLFFDKLSHGTYLNERTLH